MPNEQRRRIKRCLGKAVNHIELAIPALAEVWQVCAERDKLIAARPVQEPVPILDDGREPEPSYTESLSVALTMLDKINTLIQATSLQMMDMDHDELIRMAQ
jgi:hypothetical protein